MSRRLIAALVVTGVLSGLLAAVDRSPELPPSACPSCSAATDDGTDPSDAAHGRVHQHRRPRGRQARSPSTPARRRRAAEDRAGQPHRVGRPARVPRPRPEGRLAPGAAAGPARTAAWAGSGRPTSPRAPRVPDRDRAAAHRLTVYHRDGVFLQEPVGVGEGADAHAARRLLHEGAAPAARTRTPPTASTPTAFRATPTCSPTSPAATASSASTGPTTRPRIGKDVSHGCIRLTQRGDHPPGQEPPAGRARRDRAVSQLAITWLLRPRWLYGKRPVRAAPRSGNGRGSSLEVT